MQPFRVEPGGSFLLGVEKHHDWPFERSFGQAFRATYGAGAELRKEIDVRPISRTGSQAAAPIVGSGMAAPIFCP
jgi:hypothetical protein